MEKTRKRSLQLLFISFMLYAILGWCYEVFLEVVIYKWGFTNRGVLFGPYCPVYGVGALTFLFVLDKIMRKKDSLLFTLIKPFIIFLGCMFIATLIELIASYILEFATGSWPWQTYAEYKYNYQARIALSTSVRFGLGGTLFMYVVQPLFDFILSKPSKKTLNMIAGGFLFIILVDCVYTFFIK